MLWKFFVYISFFLLGINKDCRDCIYLTIDDGPSSITTEILKLLSDHNVKGTFFVLGSNVKKYPDVVRSIYKDGHLIANHTYSHKNFYKVKPTVDVLREEIKKTEEEIIKIIGYKPGYLRYPYGYISKEARDVASSLGYRVINWDFGYDWHPYSEDVIISQYIKNLKPGSIILIHDLPQRKKMVLRLIEEIIKEGKRKGYRFVRLDEIN